ncbi:MAG: hypothetical protein IT569_02490 [Leptospiraceae bacterium]|nr:hypothetical protein [Leptospiraceae bacterium]
MSITKQMPLNMPKNIAILILCLLLLAAQCKEIAFNNACDPSSDEYNKSILAKLALKDGSPPSYKTIGWIGYVDAVKNIWILSGVANK